MAEHFDVIIVGAGLSGIGAACNLTRQLPKTTYVVLEARDAMGGTWDFFRYPGVRSDSDMHTMGYRFKPWMGDKQLASASEILGYVREAARENGVDSHIRYRHDVIAASWSSDRDQWTVEVEVEGRREELTCGLLWSCGGYYDYANPYQPEFPGREDFAGQIVHPQFWPEDLDYAGRNVVVIGSGATAVTLVPAMAGEAEHVTMLQRSPTYVISVPNKDKIALTLRRFLPSRAAYFLARWKNILLYVSLYQFSRRRPQKMRSMLRKGVVRALPEGFDVDTHFNPSYDPWDQRLCFVPDNDLFKAIRRGEASVVTDTIERFTQKGVLLSSGEELQADIIVTATGLAIRAFSGARLEVDGRPVSLSETMSYKAMMLSGVPNLVFTIGYTNISWTLKADLVADYTCRLLAHMQRNGYTRVVPVPDPAMDKKPLIDLTSSYVLRALDSLPKQGVKEPWMLKQNYVNDIRRIRRGEIEDGVLAFDKAPAPVAAQP